MGTEGDIRVLMSGEKFFYSVKIREHHLDAFGHVNNTSYLQILEEARWDWITSNGYGQDEVLRTGLAPVIIEINLKMKKELRLRDDVTIECYANVPRHRLFTINQTIRIDDGQVCTLATIRSCVFDLHARKMVEPTPEWLKALGLTH